MVLLALGSESPEPLLRVFLNAFDHHDQITPFHGIAVGFRVIFRQLEAACLQPFDVHHHASVIRMEQFHEFAAGSDKDEHVTVPHFALHLLMHQSAQRTDALAHVCPAGTQKVAHRIVQTKHGSFRDYGLAVPLTASRIRSRSGHGDRWGKARLHPAAPVHPRSVLQWVA